MSFSVLRPWTKIQKTPVQPVTSCRSTRLHSIVLTGRVVSSPPLHGNTRRQSRDSKETPRRYAAL